MGGAREQTALLTMREQNPPSVVSTWEQQEQIRRLNGQQAMFE